MFHHRLFHGRPHRATNRFGAKYFIACLVTIAGALPAFAVTTTFNTDLEGWRVTGDNAAAWQSTTGHPGGCLSVNDLVTGSMNWIVAPPSFLGDWRAMAVTDSLSMDIFFTNTSGGALIPAAWLFRLSGPGGVAVTQVGAIPSQSVWTRLGAGLNAAEWTMQSGTWAALLENVDTVMIMGEYVNGAEIVRVDNIRLTGPVTRVVPPCVVETFNAAGLGDWSFQDTGGTSNPGSGGNSGGFCQVGDGSNLSYVFAPSRFLGNWSPFDGTGFLSVDVRVINGGSAWLSVPEFIRLSGPGGVAVASMNTAQLPPASRLWKTFTFPLQPATWTMISGTWAGLLADVTEWRLQAEFMGVTETIGLDNIARLTGECEMPDQAVTAQDPAVRLCGRTGIVGLASVARNPLDGQIYGTVDVAGSSGGGLWAVTGPFAGTRLQSYDLPAHLIFDAAGDCFLTADNSGNVYRRAADGVSSLWVAGFHAGDDDPFGMCFAPAGFSGPNVAPGDIVVTDRGYSGPDEVWAFSPTAAESERQVLVDPGNVDYFDIAASAAGTVYLADALAIGTLSMLSPSGALTTLALSSPLTGIVSVVVDDGLSGLYILEKGAQTLCRVDPISGVVETVATGFVDVMECGLEIDVAGRRLWVVDGGANRLYEFCLGAASAVGEGGASGAQSRGLTPPRIWPNPSTGGTSISFALVQEADTRLEIYDLAGRLVRRVLSDRLPAGESVIAWDGRDGRGRSVSAGLYVARLSAGGQVRTATVAVVR